MSRLVTQRGVALRALGTDRPVQAIGVARGSSFTRRYWLALSGDVLFVLAVERAGAARVEAAVATGDCESAGSPWGPWSPVSVAGRKLWMHRGHSDPGLLATFSEGPGGRAAAGAGPRTRQRRPGSGVAIAVRRSWLAVGGGCVGALLLVAWLIAGWP